MATDSESARGLKSLRERAGYTVRELARELGRQPSSYAFYENDYKKPFLPPDLVRELLPLLSGRGDPAITDADVLGLGGLMPAQAIAPRPRPAPADDQRLAAIPELDVRAGAGGVQLGEANVEDPGMRRWQLPIEMIQAQTSAPMSALRIITVFGDSMEPTFTAGTKVLVDTADTIPSPPGIFVVFDGLGIALKRVQHIPFSEPPTVKITSDNVRYDPYERTLGEAHLQGRVIGLWRWT